MKHLGCYSPIDSSTDVVGVGWPYRFSCRLALSAERLGVQHRPQHTGVGLFRVATGTVFPFPSPCRVCCLVFLRAAATRAIGLETWHGRSDSRHAAERTREGFFCP